MHFRNLIQANQKNYVKSDPGEKKRIVNRLVKEAQLHGRFLKQNSNAGKWVHICCGEVKGKIGQALRYNVTAERQEITNNNDEATNKTRLSSNPTPALGMSQGLTYKMFSTQYNPMMDISLRMIRKIEDEHNQIKRKQRELEDEQSSY